MIAFDFMTRGHAGRIIFTIQCHFNLLLHVEVDIIDKRHHPDDMPLC